MPGEKPLSTADKLNLETARIPFSSLQGHFARGVALRVAGGIDLVAVATALAEDRAEQVEGWRASGELAPVSDAEALAWIEEDATVWAVVVAPFVLVQAA